MFKLVIAGQYESMISTMDDLNTRIKDAKNVHGDVSVELFENVNGTWFSVHESRYEQKLS